MILFWWTGDIMAQSRNTYAIIINTLWFGLFQCLTNTCERRSTLYNVYQGICIRAEYVCYIFIQINMQGNSVAMWPYGGLLTNNSKTLRGRSLEELSLSTSGCHSNAWTTPPNLLYQLLCKLAKTSTNQKKSSIWTFHCDNPTRRKKHRAHVPVKLETFQSAIRGSELSLQAVEGSHQSGNFTPGRFSGDEFQFWSAKRFAKIRWFKWLKGWWVFLSKESLCEINHVAEGST